jgi:hypothetical protein
MGQDQLDKFLKEKLSQHQTPIDNDALWNSIQGKKEPEIDQIVKQKLFDYEAPVDSQIVWNNIAKEVTGKSSYGWMKIAAAVLILGALLIAGLYLNNSKSETISSLNKDNNYNTEFNDNDSNNSNISNRTNQIDESTLVVDDINSDKNLDKNLINKVKLNVDDLKTENKLHKNTKLQSDFSIPSTEKISNSDLSAEAENKTDRNTYTDSDVNANIVKLDQLRLTKESLAVLEKSIDDNKTTSRDAERLIMPNLDALKNNALSVVSAATEDATAYADGLPDEDICFSWNKSIECYSYKPKNFHFSILGYTTADYYRKSMSQFPDIEPQTNYLENRKNTQRAQISNRSGLLLKMMHKKGLYVKVGIEAGFLRERFSHQTRDTVTQIIPDQLINIDVDMNGDTTFTYGNAPVTTISSKNWRVNNSHRTIGIPLLIGYEKKMKRFDLGVEIGALYNFHRSFEGWLLGPPEDPSDARDYFTSSNDLNFTGGINLGFQINTRFKLLGLASFRQNLNTINNESVNDISQKNTIFGLGIGLEFKI